MNKKTISTIFTLLLLFAASSNVKAEDWWDKLALLQYSPRYFAANAFPLPEMMGGALPTRWELELRGEIHRMPGDKTEDVYARLYVPIAGGRAGVTVSGVIKEWYKTSEAVRDERNAADVYPVESCNGDVIVNCYYQVLRSKKWMDIIVSANMKTASGGRVCDARYTDAVTYWFDTNIGRTLWQTDRASFRMEGLVGFYCWMTNDLIKRQNDAFLYGIGARGHYRNFSLRADCSGFVGAHNNGDRPIVLRTKLEYELKKNILSFGYKHGIQDYLYDSYSLAYIRCF